MFADEVIRARKAAVYRAQRRRHQRGEVVVKFFWAPLIISIVLSILATIILNVIF
jgi:hypothetical protein